LTIEQGHGHGAHHQFTSQGMGWKTAVADRRGA